MVIYVSKVPAVPCNGNQRFRGWEPGVPISGNRQFLAMVTCGSKVRNEEFQPNGNLWFPGSELAVSNLGKGPLSKTKRFVPDQ